MAAIGHDAVQAGAGAALVKPYDLDRLLALVERNCQPSRSSLSGDVTRRPY
jgi:hypothetical protein